VSIRNDDYHVYEEAGLWLHMHTVCEYPVLSFIYSGFSVRYILLVTLSGISGVEAAAPDTGEDSAMDIGPAPQMDDFNILQ